ncbi:MAG: MBL fold metallo-hydrolase [Desulfobacteraceae bacterium]|nr:MAG: MBL fold metallo-hydrolase [Desulfobacteraceae bacterium]
MSKVSVQFLGSGDAFGSGGRFNACIYVQAPSGCFLLDCGASSLIALKRFGVDPDRLDYIFLTHLHGDHFGGVPTIIRETDILAKRTKPLAVCGPQGLEQRIRVAIEIFYPGAPIHENFPLTFLEWDETEPQAVGPLKAQAYPALHSPGARPHMLRIEVDHKIIAYTGDTEWTDDLLRVADGADLLICDCFTVEKKKNHLDYRTLQARRGDLNCRRLILTHMGDDMLTLLPNIEFEWAEDGKQFNL